MLLAGDEPEGAAAAVFLLTPAALPPSFPAWYVTGHFPDVSADGGLRMPFVNITIYEGHAKERKDEIARRVTDTITEVCKLPREAVWVVFNEVTPPDWYVAGTPGKK